MDERSERILMVAMKLAERDGYDAVRLRDLAAEADVALGTVYKRFKSKEDILAAALELIVTRMHEALASSPIPGASQVDRLDWFFETATRQLANTPKLAAALLRTVASGVPEVAEKVTQFYGQTTEIILAVYRGRATQDFPTAEEELVCRLLQHVWFASLVGWTGGLHDPETVVAHMKQANRWLLRGVENP